MRGAVLTMAAVIGVIGGGVAVAGSANAVGDSATCAVLSTAIDDFSAKTDAIDTSNGGGLAETKRVWAELTTKFADAEANADDGRVRVAVGGAVAQLNRLAAVADSDRQSVINDPAFMGAMSAVDTACGF
ncbi:hypothetical protein ACQP0C_20490 [Nocardia sp. CA-129566]|uniref:hypothetical protein n=1 Tax=Nocardia sp. CA-129566 TaxID=3239976 RepID=UPI003D9971A4